MTAINIKMKVAVDVVKKLPEVLMGKISDMKTKINGTKIIFIDFFGFKK